MDAEKPAMTRLVENARRCRANDWSLCFLRSEVPNVLALMEVGLLNIDAERALEAPPPGPCTCAVVIQEGPFAYAPEMPEGATLKIEYCEQHQGNAAPRKPTREQVEDAVMRGISLAQSLNPLGSPTWTITDEIMKLLEYS